MVMVGWVLFKDRYVLTCRILGLIVVLFRGDQAAATEVLVLRHENAVLLRHAERVRYEAADRIEQLQGDHYEGQFEGQNGASGRSPEPVSACVS
jgi:hypothetical protein